MMEGLRQWIITLITILIFLSFVEFLLPRTSYRRYIHVVMGLVIMLAMLRPFMGLLGEGQLTGEQILQSTNQLEQLTLNHRVQAGTINQEDNIMKMYKDQLQVQMAARLETQFGIRGAEILLDIEEKETGKIGTIKGVTLVLRDPEEEPILENTGIQPVHVNVNLSGKSNNKPETESISIGYEREDILRDFSSFYNIAKENIQVSVQENR